MTNSTRRSTDYKPAAAGFLLALNALTMLGCERDAHLISSPAPTVRNGTSSQQEPYYTLPSHLKTDTLAGPR